MRWSGNLLNTSACVDEKTIHGVTCFCFVKRDMVAQNILAVIAHSVCLQN